MTSIMTTMSGKQIDPTNMRDEDINIRDIAYHLSTVNRFGGAARPPISVGQHSFYVSKLCPTNCCALQGLLHDASEAYMGDVIKWLKSSDIFAGYREVEQRLERQIFRKFGVAEEQCHHVRAADTLMVRYEAHRVMPRLHAPPLMAANYPPLTEDEIARVGEWQPWDYTFTESIFLARAEDLGVDFYPVEHTWDSHGGGPRE